MKNLIIFDIDGTLIEKKSFPEKDIWKHTLNHDFNIHDFDENILSLGEDSLIVEKIINQNNHNNTLRELSHFNVERYILKKYKKFFSEEKFFPKTIRESIDLLNSANNFSF